MKSDNILIINKNVEVILGKFEEAEEHESAAGSDLDWRTGMGHY